jgi:hypothetical protein
LKEFFEKNDSGEEKRKKESEIQILLDRKQIRDLERDDAF